MSRRGEDGKGKRFGTSENPEAVVPAKEEGRPPRWKDGLARSFAHSNRPQLQCLMPWKIFSSNGTETGRSKRLACGNPGAMTTRCDAGLLRGTYARCRGESTDQTSTVVITDEMLTFGLKSWSRGQKSQAASALCSGGVSAVIGSSDLDEHTLASGGVSGNQP